MAGKRDHNNSMAFVQAQNDIKRLKRQLKEEVEKNEVLLDRAMSAEAMLRAVRTENTKVNGWITEAIKK
jgi:hypothetical protein